MQNTLNTPNFGSATPALEGAPASASHENRRPSVMAQGPKGAPAPQEKEARP